MDNNTATNVPFPAGTQCFIITIPENDCRATASRFTTEDLVGPTTVLMQERDNMNPMRGCFESHVRAARTALENPECRWALILEDDIAWEQDSEKRHEAFQDATTAANRIDATAEPAIIWFGHMPARPMYRRPDDPPRILVTPEPRYCHAYMPNRAALELIAAMTFQNQHYDIPVASMGTNLAIDPPVCFQRDLPTSNGSTAVYRMLAWLRSAVGYRTFTGTVLMLMRCRVAAASLLQPRLKPRLFGCKH